MSLFTVPGWSVASGPVSRNTSQTKKRKRPSTVDSKLHADQVNLEKLVKKLKGPEESDQARDKTRTTTRSKKGKSARISDQAGGNPKANTSIAKNVQSSSSAKTAVKSSTTSTSTVYVSSTKTKSQHTNDTALTAMQKGMREKLDGARFRVINETLYKTDSADAHQMMQADPTVYEEYHNGFRHQVQSWPTNPVLHYLDVLSKYPEKTVIADLGCGDAALARSLIPQGMTVLSFDLVSDGEFVVEADTCTRIPLPGSEGSPSDKSVGSGHVVDVVVCALSLMGTNWTNCIREAWRILKPNGQLKIAEVASRFTAVDEFTLLIGSIGFRLKSKDDSNTHFTLFEFVKVPRKGKNDKEWANAASKGSVLKACEYKRR